MYRCISGLKLSLAIVLFKLSATPVPAQDNGPLSIIPQPVSAQLTEGYLDFRTAGTYYFSKAPDLDPMYDFSQWIRTYYGRDIKRSIDKESFVKFIQTDTFSHQDAYRLIISRKGILISYKDEAGAFYATQTLKQLFPPEKKYISENNNVSLSLPHCDIYDYPRFSYRGMHLDESRHFFGTDAVKKYIDMLAFQKMNYFHWHLTDDQGWRIEIKKYPKLTQIASCRDETLIGHYSDKPVQYDGERYCHFYTQDQVREIVEYARKRYITIVPEIEMPGHASAALSAYPELGCSGKPVRAKTTWGVFEDIFCPKEGTFLFLNNVLDEVMDLFPSRMIHIGGDEVPKKQWKECDFCQQLIRQKRLKNEHGLQSYFIQRIEKHVNSRGRVIIGWDEILEGGLAPNAIVMSWRGTEGGIEAAMLDHEVIMTPGSHCYFDYYQARGPQEPVAIGGLTTLKRVYSFDPVPEKLASDKQRYILGGQANLWTEYIATPSHLQYMAYPRSFAIAEALWSPKNGKQYEDFVRRLRFQLPRLDAWGINYAQHFFNIEIRSQKLDNAQKFVLKTDIDHVDLMYRISQGKTTTAWLKYSGPVSMEGAGVIEARIIDDIRKVELPAVLKEYDAHKGLSALKELKDPPNEKYNAGGPEALTNGLKGPDDNYGGDEWLGFLGKDLEATLDLNSVQKVHQVEMRFYNSPGQWIYPPRGFRIFAGNDINHLQQIQFTLETTEMGKISKSTLRLNEGVEAQYIRVVADRFGIIPDGAQGAGSEAWLFCDEIIVR